MDCDAQRYQALRARIGDTAIEKLMAGDAAVVPVIRYLEGCGLRLNASHPSERVGNLDIDEIRIDKPEEPQG